MSVTGAEEKYSQLPEAIHFGWEISSKNWDSSSFQTIIDKLVRELKNRRILNGTYGGVGGRLLN